MDLCRSKKVIDTVHAGRGRESEMKFFSLCAELYKGTASRGWKKHKIGDNTPIFQFLFCFDEMGVDLFDNDRKDYS